MTWRAGAALVAASAADAVLTITAAGRIGADYGEVVPYVLTRLEILGPEAADSNHGRPPRFGTSPWLPRLAFEIREGCACRCSSSWT